MNNEAIIVAKKYYNAMFFEKNPNVVKECFPKEFLFNGRSMTSEKILELVTRLIFSSFHDIKIEVTHQFGDKEWVATRLLFSGVHEGKYRDIEPTHKRVEFQSIGLDRVVNGKIVDMWHEQDIDGILQQLNS